jgi:hypothetical protein
VFRGKKKQSTRDDPEQAMLKGLQDQWKSLTPDERKYATYAGAGIVGFGALSLLLRSSRSSSGKRHRRRRRSAAATPAASDRPTHAADGTLLDRSKFRHYPEDFTALVTRPLHMNLQFDMTADRVVVTTTTTFVYDREQKHVGQPLQSLALNAKELCIRSVDMVSVNLSMCVA